MLEESAVSIPGPRNITLKKLSKINVIFGRNGCGKSWILRKVRDQQPGTLYIPPERFGNISTDLGRAEQERSSERRGKDRQTNVHPNFSSEAVSKVHSLATNMGLLVGRGKEVNENTWEKLETVMNSLLPGFKFQIDHTSRDLQGLVLLKRETLTDDGAQIKKIEELSSGEVQIFTLALDVITSVFLWEQESNEKKLICIDEPDVHLHPELQQRLGEFFCRISEQYDVQLLIATHSTTMVSALGGHSQNGLHLYQIGDASSEIQPIVYNDYLSKITKVLGGHLLMGPLFGAKLLLVEGEDDADVWSTASRGIATNFAVVSCNGDEITKYQKILEGLFNSLIGTMVGPLGFALRDGDKCAPNPVNVPQSYVPFKILNCLMTENLYLADEVLQEMGLNWDEAKILIKASITQENLSDELSERMKKCDEWDRRSENLKLMMSYLQRILDKNRYSWRIRIGKKLGKDKPVGQLAEFLGADIAQDFWG